MSVKIYDYEKEELSGKRYSVSLDGVNVPCHEARVSAYPFNRRWPGRQRSIEQSELSEFLSFAMDSPVEIRVKPNFDFEKYKIKPASKKISSRREADEVVITLKEPTYFVVEFDNYHNCLHIFADAINEYGVDINSPDTIYFGKGFHDAGVIEMKSNQTLFIDEGAVVYASVFVTDAENIKIVGSGILDNSKNKEKILFEADNKDVGMAVLNAERRHTVRIEYCNNVYIDGITIRDSLVYNIRPICCSDVEIRNVKIIGCWRYNSDGIDMHNCCNVLIDNCFIRTFDDCVCIKGFDPWMSKDGLNHDGRIFNTFENAVIKNCVIWNDWDRGLEIGAETYADKICNISFEDCDVIYVTGPALDIYNVDHADVFEVRYKNINIECEDGCHPMVFQASEDMKYTEEGTDTENPIIFGAWIVKHREYTSDKNGRRGRIHDISYENINVTSPKSAKIDFKGYDGEYRVENISIKDLYVNDKKIERREDLIFECNEFVGKVDFL